MSKRYPSGFISTFYDPLKNPDAPTIGAATGGTASASVAFTAPTNVGGSAISSYSALSTPGGLIGSAASSPISVTGLTNGTAYTFAVWAINTYGPSAYSASSGSVTPNVYAYFGGGVLGGSRTASVQRVAFGTSGSAASFASLTQARSYIAACASATRGVWGAGRDVDANNVNTIDYVTLATGGGASDFGDLTSTRIQPAGASNSTRGLFAGGSGSTSSINYITIATTGNATSFGGLTVGRYGAGGCASPTRAVFSGGGSSASADAGTNIIDYVTIDTTGNATDFGDLILACTDVSACSNATRGVTFGGRSNSTAFNTIEYITIASTGNATDFGDLTQKVPYCAAAASSVYAIRSGGSVDYSAATNVMDYITIASTGNATDFGDMTNTLEQHAGCSNAHGGLS